MEKNRYIFLFFELLVVGVFVIGMVSADISSSFNDLFAGADRQQIILTLIVIVILFAVLYDITMFMPFITSNPVRYIVAGGLTLAAVITGGMYKIYNAVLVVVASFGAAGVFIAIFVSIAIFIGLMVGNTFLAKWAAKIKGQQEELKAIKNANEAGATIQALRALKRTGLRGN
ncbi:MAG: hypothetical protein AABW51_01195 [Nanoarchaeota archaeon]